MLPLTVKLELGTTKLQLEEALEEAPTETTIEWPRKTQTQTNAMVAQKISPLDSMMLQSTLRLANIT
jgi:hypothetical protein